MLKITLLLFLSFCSQAAAKPLILFVHSYNMDKYKWTASIQEGFIQKLSKNGLVINEDYHIRVEQLDSHTYYKSEEKKERGKLILNRIKTFKPDYIITTDDDALEYVGHHIKDIPVIFNGINKDMKYYFANGIIESIEKPGHNLTGIYQTIYFEQSIELLQKIKPEVKTYAFIGDHSNTSQSLYTYLQKIVPSIQLKYVDSHISNSSKKWKEVLKSWEGKVDVVLTGTPVELVNEKGHQLGALEAFKFLIDNTNALVLGNWVFQVEYGALLSMADSGHQQGWYTGEYLLRVLNGEKIGDLPIITPKEGIPSINLTELKRRNLKLSRKLRWNIFENGIVKSEDN